jgi:hypothetical protein
VTTGLPPSLRVFLRTLTARARPYLPALVASSILAAIALRLIVAEAGRSAAPLDDSFIHLQYARRLAEGHFFSYTEGAGYTTGATSLLWPLLLAPFVWLGFKGLSLLWIAWAWGTLAHAATALEAYRLAHRLAGRGAALGAALMCICFGALSWFAWSAMETMPLAWALLRSARVASSYVEGRDDKQRATWSNVAITGFLAAIVRPEGVIGAGIAAIALAVHVAPSSTWRARLRGLAPLAGPLVVPMMHLALSGHAASATTMVKWLVANPYYSSLEVRAFSLNNAHLLVTDLLDGGPWTAVFLPEHASWPILLGLLALPVAGLRRRAPWTAVFVGMVALGTLLPCTYLSFLWNRVRYIWPFAGAWFVLVACFAREVGDLVRRLAPRATSVTPLLAGGYAALLASKLPWTMRDLAQSARAIDHQQVTLGEWAAKNLPKDARVGVNDTGAIAYFSGRTTFDVVGLTTEGEAKYWVAGAGARFEHYEKMAREKLPTHFIVYPQWMAIPAVLGAELERATVTDQSILGGVTMIAYEASWELLGSGARPEPPPKGEPIDDIDIGDIDSEVAHHYSLDGSRESDSLALTHDPIEPGAKVMAEGGRKGRLRDWFEADVRPQGTLVMRVIGDEAKELTVFVNGKEVGRVDAGFGDWTERRVELPADLLKGRASIEVRGDGGRFTSLHYWVY